MTLKKLWWVPNFLSILRIIVIPVFVYLLSLNSYTARIWALVIFILASITDALDGWSARKLNQESEMGKFLDPLADKFLVIATLTAFLFLDPLIPLWMIFIIVGRDLLITIMRYLAIKKGKSLRTSHFGKFKTAFQMISIIVIIMVFIERSSGISINPKYFSENYLRMHTAWEIVQSNYRYKWLVVGPYYLMTAVTLLTAMSGIRYLITNWKVLLPPYNLKKKVEKNGKV